MTRYLSKKSLMTRLSESNSKLNCHVRTGPKSKLIIILNSLSLPCCIFWNGLKNGLQNRNFSMNFFPKKLNLFIKDIKSGFLE